MNQTFPDRRDFFSVFGILLFTTACSTSRPPDIAEKMDYRLKQYAQEISCDNKPLSLKPGQTVEESITAKNTGSDVWTAHGARPVRLGYQLFVNARLLPIEGQRSWLPVDLAPGVVQPLMLAIAAPSTAGRYTVKFTMVHEGVTWFSDAGAKTCDVELTVQ